MTLELRAERRFSELTKAQTRKEAGSRHFWTRNHRMSHADPGGGWGALLLYWSPGTSAGLYWNDRRI